MNETGSVAGAAPTAAFPGATVWELVRRSTGWLATRPGFWTLIAIGAALRLRAYLANVSLEVGEAELALNLVGRSYGDLLRPLDYDQGAPIGFLFVERFLLTTLGNTEYALRLFPFIAAVLALPLLWRASQRYLSPPAVPLALGLFAISRAPITFAAQVKQYSSDVMFTLIVLLLAERAWRLRSAGSLVALGLVGAVTLWFSHSAAFVASGAGVCLGLAALRARDRRLLGGLALVGITWVASLGVLYVVSLRNLTQNTFLLDYWAGGFMPFPPKSLNDLRWFVEAPVLVFASPGGFAAYWLAAGLGVLGAYRLLRGRPLQGLMLLAPVALTLVASAARQYPFTGRLVLFLVPVVVLLVAEGLELVRAATRATTPAIYAVLLAVLAFDPVASAAVLVRAPGADYDQPRRLIEHLSQRYQPSDVIYVYNDAQYAFRYYAPRFGIDEQGVVIGRSRDGKWNEDAADLAALQGKPRVWLLLSHLRGRNAPMNEGEFFEYELDRRGTRLDEARAPGAVLYLYDMRAVRPQ